MPIMQAGGGSADPLRQRELVKALEGVGFVVERRTKHVILKKGERTLSLTGRPNEELYGFPLALGLRYLREETITKGRE